MDLNVKLIYWDLRLRDRLWQSLSPTPQKGVEGQAKILTWVHHTRWISKLPLSCDLVDLHNIYIKWNLLLSSFRKYGAESVARTLEGAKHNRCQWPKSYRYSHNMHIMWKDLKSKIGWHVIWRGQLPVEAEKPLKKTWQAVILKKYCVFTELQLLLFFIFSLLNY